MERRTDIKLLSVSSEISNPKLVFESESIFSEEMVLNTSCGDFHIGIQGVRRGNRSFFITFHDLGLNAEQNFGSFFSHEEMKQILQHFCVLHVTAPEQMSVCGGTFPSEKPYPTMDELADGLEDVVAHYSVKSFIGFGCGLGSNVLTRFALKHPSLVDGLFLINGSMSACSWMDWFYLKRVLWHLRTAGLTRVVEEYMIWYWLGYHTQEMNYDLCQTFRSFLSQIHLEGLMRLMHSWATRTPLDLCRDNLKLTCPTVIVVGGLSPHEDDSVLLNSSLDPKCTTWMKVSDSGGAPLEEKPFTVVKSFLLFLQGMGRVPHLNFAKVKCAQREKSEDRFEIAQEMFVRV